MFQIVNRLCSHCHMNNSYCLSNAKSCYNLKSCHFKIQPVALNRIITELEHCCSYREWGRNENYWRKWKNWLQSFQFCQNNSKVHFLKDFNVKKNDVSKLKILSKWQLSILEDKNVCQNNKYHHNYILNSLFNTLRCIINSNTCCWKNLPIYINKCCTITLTVFQLMNSWLNIIFRVQFINCL